MNAEYINSINSDNFDQGIASNENVIYYFTAQWCGPCRMIKPIIQNISKKYKDKIFIGQVDVDSNIDSAIQHKISSVPTFLFFKNGKAVDKKTGFITEDQILDIFNI